MGTVTTDIQTLKKVIVHYPDDGIEVITPANALRFLYDDIVFLPKMREEHELFTRIISHFTGKENVLDTYKMLVQVLKKNPENSKQKLLNYVFQHEKCSDITKAKVEALDEEELAYTLFTGILKEENRLIFGPLPNYVFTRDIGVVINDHIVICHASKKARTRETILTRYLIYYHPAFKSFQETKIIDMTRMGEDSTIEGGDVMMLNKDYLLVGCSERTSPEAINKLKSELFEKNVIKNVVRIVIPKDRSCMHIDTLFTQISENEFVIYEETLISDLIKVTEFHQDGTKTEHSSLKDFFLSVNPKMKFILCGNGEDFFDEREQWTDGCNLVALKNGVAIAYDRNEKTAEALRNAGYKIIDGKTFLENKPDISKVERTIISIPSTELSRARGGPHCMTFPIERS
jgi:arginine deiminase